MSDAVDNGAFVEEGKRVGRNALFLVGSRLAAMLLALAQTAIIGNSLSVEGSGQFLYALGFSALFTVFATLGVQRVLVREISRNPAEHWDAVWSATALIAVLCFFTMGTIWFSAEYLVEDPAKRWAIMLAALSVVVLWALQRPFEAVLIAYERMGWLAWVNLVGAGLKVVAVAAAFALMNDAWMPYGSAVAHGVIAAANLLAFLLCVAFAFWVGGWHTPRFNAAHIVRQLAEGLPLSLAMLFSLIYFKADIFLLERALGDTGVGIYFPVQRLMEPLLMTAGLWGTAVFPALCRLAQSAPGDYAQMTRTSLRMALMLSVPMAFGIGVLAEFLVKLLVGPDALIGASTDMMRWYAPVVPFFFMNTLAQETLYAGRRNWLVVFAYACAAVVCVLGNLWAVPKYGYVGLCYAAIASNVIVSLVFMYGLHRELGQLRLPILFLRICGACILMGGLAYLIAPYNAFLAAGAGAVLYIALLFPLNAFNETERSILWGLLPGKLRRGADD